MVVDVSYILKEHSEDAMQASSGVTGILAVQGAFAEHAAMLDRLGAPWKLLRAREDLKEHSEDAMQASSGVTGILAVQGAFAEHAAMLDRLGAPWKLLRAREDFDESIDRVILPGGESTTQGKLLRSTGLFDPINEHIKAGKLTA